ncbi:PilZ domain-containing protein [Methylomagnum ishizawai]|uniref:PilZ domain-containing protein n=1 Tax=Methylomagnum ishizawai TaxID=1760988 RepID=A0A1Y6CYM4_9GAMM|nr:PilZ domain-containing protein [Methylomagnum ishizawai]SMF95330.1 PilZ domain-containing protein [Methylomagnum ishizawai]
MSEQRHFYRKKLTSTGYLILPSGEERKFSLLDLSLRGLQAEFDHNPGLQPEQILRIELPDQSVEGLVTVVRITPQPEGTCHIGFQINRMDGVGDNTYRFRDDDE